ncbi:MAG: coenzyme F420-0:L-glutamate ligase [Halobacteriales archaeon]|nr:coenzyme F420-0:L-glutamate ligase [Halobacteriales archaeon]
METTVRPVENIPMLGKGDSLAQYLADGVGDADLVAVASTAVSKVEGRKRALEMYNPSERARELASRLSNRDDKKDARFAQAVLEESVELLIEEPFLLAVTRFGHVAPNAGIDRSNVEGDGTVLLLPRAPHESAARLHDALGTPVVVTDTCGRAFRRGQTGVAVGWAGIDALIDWRGEKGLHGHELEATEEAVVDEIAGYANLHMGEGNGGTPAVVFEGIESLVSRTDDDVLFRPEEDDVVRSALREFKR